MIFSTCTTTSPRIRQQKFDIFQLKNKSQHWTTPHTRQISLPPPDYFLFTKVKLQLKGAILDTNAVIQKAVTDKLNKIPLQKTFLTPWKSWKHVLTCVLHLRDPILNKLTEKYPPSFLVFIALVRKFWTALCIHIANFNIISRCIRRD